MLLNQFFATCQKFSMLLSFNFVGPRVLMAPVSSSLVPQTVISTPQQAPVSAVADNEAAACNWLLTQYELSADSSLKKMEMYRKYASVFGVYGLQNLVSPTCFASCIRLVFSCWLLLFSWDAFTKFSNRIS